MNKTVKIVNKFQVVLYMKHGVKPIDIELGEDDKMLYIFDKEETKEVWELWKQSCIEYKRTLQKH